MKTPKYYRLFFVTMFMAFYVSNTDMEFAQASDEEVPTFKEIKASEGYTLDLKKLIKESKKKIDQVDDKLRDQAKHRRNQMREAKAREYYEKANHLFKQGLYEEAEALWEKAIKITEHPEMENYVHENIKKIKRLDKALAKEEQRRLKRLEMERGYTVDEVENAYSEAISLYKQKKYLAAKEAFERVNDMFPDHKATKSYLKLINHKIGEKQKELIAQKMQERLSDSKSEKETWKKALKLREQEREFKLKAQAEKKYQEALVFYKNKDFQSAKEKFQQVEWIIPNYKKTTKYLAKLAKIPTGLMAKNMEGSRLKKAETKLLKEQLKEKYATARTAFSENDFATAERLFDEIYHDTTTYKDVGHYRKRLKKIKSAQALVKRYQEDNNPSMQARLADFNRKDPDVWTEKEYLNLLDDEMNTVYQQAKQSYTDEDFYTARSLFRKLFDIEPDYKNVDDYLAKIKRQDLAPINEDQEWPLKTESSDQNVEVGVDIHKQEYSEQILTDVEQKYAQAMALYNQGQILNAKMMLIQVEALAPNYKSVRKYLADIQDLERRQQVHPSDAISEVAQSSTTTVSTDVVENKQILERKSIQRDSSIKNKIKPTMLTAKSMDRRVQQAILLYRAGMTEQSQRIFLSILEQDPNNVEAQRYLQELGMIDKNHRIKENMVKKIKSKSSTDRMFQVDLDKQYSLAVRKYKDKNYSEALTLFETIEEQKPKYKRVKNYINAINKKMRAQQNPSALMASKVEDPRSKVDPLLGNDEAIEDLFSEAVKLYKAKRYTESKNMFEVVEKTRPDYLNVRRYLKAVDKKLAEQERALIRRAERDLERSHEEQLSENYALALQQYDAGSYDIALKVFEQIDQTSPNYKATKTYIKRINGLLEKQGKVAASANQKPQTTRQKNMSQHMTQLKSKHAIQNNEMLIPSGRLSEIQHLQLLKPTDNLTKPLITSPIPSERVVPESPSQRAIRLTLSNMDYIALAKAQEDHIEYLKELRLKEFYRLKEYNEKKYESKKNAIIQGETYNRKKLAVAKQRQHREILRSQPESKPIEKSSNIQKPQKSVDRKKQATTSTIKPLANTSQSQVNVHKSETSSQKSAPEATRNKKEKQRYQATQRSLSHDLAKVDNKEIQRRKKMAKEAYNKAVSFYRQKRYSEAKRLFNSAENFYPGYKSTQKYIKKINKKLANQATHPIVTSSQKDNSVTSAVQAKVSQPKAKIDNASLKQKSELETLRQNYAQDVTRLQKLYEQEKHTYQRQVEELEKKQQLLTTSSTQPIVKTVQDKIPNKAIAKEQQRHNLRIKELADQREQMVQDYENKIDRLQEELQTLKNKKQQKAEKPELSKSTKNVKAIDADNKNQEFKEPIESTAQPLKHKEMASVANVNADQNTLKQIKKLNNHSHKNQKKLQKAYKKLFKQSQSNYQEIFAAKYPDAVQAQSETELSSLSSEARVEKSEDKMPAKKNEVVDNTVIKDDPNVSKKDKKTSADLNYQKKIELEKRKFVKKKSQYRAEILKQQSALKTLEQERKHLEAELEKKKLKFQKADDLNKDKLSTLPDAKTQKMNSKELSKEAQLANKEKDALLKREEAAILEKDRLARLKAKEKELEEKRRIKQLKKDIEKTYREALTLYSVNRVEESKKKFKEYEDLLASGYFESDYLMKMRNRLLKDRKRIEKQLAREEAKNQKFLERQARKNPKVKLERQQRLQALERLQDRITEEEKRLLQEQKKLAKGLANVEGSDMVSNPYQMLDVKAVDMNIKVKPMTSDHAHSDEHQALIDATNEKLSRVVNEREKNLRKQRQRIQERFENNLEFLYEKAVGFYKIGQYDDAQRIFNEIQLLKPQYKKTEKYLAKVKTLLTRQQNSNQEITLQPIDSSKQRSNTIMKALDSFEENFW